MKKPNSRAFLHGRIVGFSIAESEELLVLGFGPEHLREVLLAIAREAVRAGGDLCYGGHLRGDGSFTRDLIDLISAEQSAETSPLAPTRTHLGRLYNPIPWPAYETLTVTDEAQWIDCYTAVRVRPGDARLDPAAEPPLATEEQRGERRAVQVAAVLTTMRRMQVEGFPVPKPYGERRSINAAILLGGKVASASGLCPGVIEEGVNAMRAGLPVFLLGGFGGGAGVLAAALAARTQKETLAILDRAFRRFAHGPRFAILTRGLVHTPLPPGFPQPAALLAEIRTFLAAGAGDFARTLANGLSARENEALFQCTDPFEAARLVMTGLRKVCG